MKAKQFSKITISFLLLFSLLTLSLTACGERTGTPAGDPLDGKTVSIDGDDGSVCFFGATEEIRALYDALAKGDDGVASYLREREAAHEYLDTLARVNSASKARYVLTDILDLPIAVFPEGEFVSAYYIRSVGPKVHRPEYSSFDPSGTPDFQVLYNFDEVRHFSSYHGVSVQVLYHRSSEDLKSHAEDSALTPIETLDINGYSMKIYVKQSYDGSFYAYATVLTEKSLTTITVPVKSEEGGAKSAVELLHKANITTLRKVIGVEGE